MPKGVYQRSPETLKIITQRVKEARKKRSYHPRTQEERTAISIGTKKALEGKPAWNKGLTKDTDKRVAKYALSNKGKVISLEQRKQISATLKEHPLRYWLGKHRSPETILKIKEARARQKALPRKGSLPEKLIEAQLRARNALYIPNFPLSEISKNLEADFFLFEFGWVLLFVDGDFIHANPALYKANDIIWKKAGKTAEKIWKHDSEINNKLVKAGYTVIRIWEKDILEDPIKTLDGVFKLLNLVK